MERLQDAIRLCDETTTGFARDACQELHQAKRTPGFDQAPPRPLTVQTRAPRLAGMEVHFTPEQEAQLSQIASHAGTDTERLVKDAALRLLEQDARFRAAVREGIAQADRGEFIEEEEMEARIERMLNS